MNKKILACFIFTISFVIAVNFISCSKETTTTTNNPPPTNPPDTLPPPTDPCAGKTIIITAKTDSAEPCGGSGSIILTASGSTGFTYKLNANGVYQASGTFNNVNAGSYTVFAKDSAGCEQSTTVVVGTVAAGPLFASVKNLVAANCESCHNNSIANGGMNFDNQCNIISNSAIINEEAVVLGAMPETGPLSQAQKNIITNWINAGAQYNN